jgi:hypothetical protein
MIKFYGILGKCIQNNNKIPNLVIVLMYTWKVLDESLKNIS